MQPDTKSFPTSFTGVQGYLRKGQVSDAPEHMYYQLDIEHSTEHPGFQMKSLETVKLLF